jgi:hypothetical protein
MISAATLDPGMFHKEDDRFRYSVGQKGSWGLDAQKSATAFRRARVPGNGPVGRTYLLQTRKHAVSIQLVLVGRKPQAFAPTQRRVTRARAPLPVGCYGCTPLTAACARKPSVSARHPTVPAIRLQPGGESSRMVMIFTNPNARASAKRSDLRWHT